MAEIAEPLVVEPFVAVALKQRPDGADEPVARYESGIQRPQPRAEHTAAHEEAVLVQRATDAREIGGVGPRAAVGARGHRYRERRIGHAAQRAPQPAVLAVADAAVLDEHAQERASPALLVPPEMVLYGGNLDGRGRRERAAELALDLLAKPVQPLLVEEVLEPRVASV